jgi:Bax protein
MVRTAAFAAMAVLIVCFGAWLAPSPAATPVIWPLPDNEGDARKAKMINQLVPAIHAENRRLMRQRFRVSVLHEQVMRGRPLPAVDRRWLEKLGDHYRMPAAEPLDSEWTALLLRRVDRVPADLALAQAAMESAWGGSRFAREANNFFGHWCFRPGCGLVPKRRPAGAVHEVETFASPAESVRRYMHNLNSHPAYTRLRIVRETLRRQGDALSGHALAAGLEKYSQLGQTYVIRVRRLMAQNELARFRMDQGPDRLAGH